MGEGSGERDGRPANEPEKVRPERPIACPECLHPAMLFYCPETPRHAIVYCSCPEGIVFRAKETVDVN